MPVLLLPDYMSVAYKPDVLVVYARKSGQIGFMN